MVNAYINCRNMKIGPYVDNTNENWLKYPDVNYATNEHWLRSILMLIMLPWQRSKLQLRRGSGIKRRQISFEIVSLLHELKFAPRNDFSSSHPFLANNFTSLAKECLPLFLKTLWLSCTGNACRVRLRKCGCTDSQSCQGWRGVERAGHDLSTILGFTQSTFADFGPARLSLSPT